MPCPGRDAARSPCEALLRRTGTHAAYDAYKNGPRLCSAPLREELRAALRPGRGFHAIPNRRSAILSEALLIDSEVAVSCWRVCSASKSAPSALVSDLTRSSAPACSVSTIALLNAIRASRMAWLLPSVAVWFCTAISALAMLVLTVVMSLSLWKLLVEASTPSAEVDRLAPVSVMVDEPVSLSETVFELLVKRFTPL